MPRPRLLPFAVVLATASLVAAVTPTVLLAAPLPARPGAPAAAAAAIVPADYVSTITNPYLPFAPGTTFVYTGTKDGKAARDVLAVTAKKRTIEGVSCTVLTDKLFLDGKLAETTVDWYAQDKAGNVWYFGEATKVLDAKGKVLSTEGSWQAGVNGAKAGIAMGASPKVGDTHRQEYYKGHAEDHSKVISLGAAAKVPYGSLTGLFETQEWTPLEPGVLDHELYAKGIGVVREIAVKGSKEGLDLVSITHAR